MYRKFTKVLLTLAAIGAFAGACYAYWSKKISRTDKDFTLSEEEDFDLDNDLEPLSHREYVSLNHSEAASNAESSKTKEDASDETSSKSEEPSETKDNGSSGTEHMPE